MYEMLDDRETSPGLLAASILAQSSSSSTPGHLVGGSPHYAGAAASTSAPGNGLTPTGRTKKPRRSKVAEACKFCRKSHMSCDAGRPCSRCVKRGIAHLCRDDLGTDYTPPPRSFPPVGSPVSDALAGQASSPGPPQNHHNSGHPGPTGLLSSGDLLSLDTGLDDVGTPEHELVVSRENAVASGSGSRHNSLTSSHLNGSGSGYGMANVVQNGANDRSVGGGLYPGDDANYNLSASNFNLAMVWFFHLRFVCLATFRRLYYWLANSVYVARR